jgi:adenine C2-methylase RlmN of 23S rRNA A2503 and tRNA A37
MRCTFCATGKGGFARNLAAHEILDQVLAVSELHGRRASNVGEWQMISAYCLFVITNFVWTAC